MPLRAVVFDFDGVIADSEPLHFEGFRRVLTRQGVALSKSEYYEKYLGFQTCGRNHCSAPTRSTEAATTDTPAAPQN